MRTALDTANYLATHIPWAAIAASGVLSPLLLAIKKTLSIQSEKVMITLVAVLSGSAAALNYLLHVPTQDPSIIAVQGAVLGFMTQPVYFMIVKPASVWFGNTLAAATAYRAEIQSAVVPAGGLPVVTATGTASSTTETTTSSTTDFTD